MKTLIALLAATLLALPADAMPPLTDIIFDVDDLNPGMGSAQSNTSGGVQPYLVTTDPANIQESSGVLLAAAPALVTLYDQSGLATRLLTAAAYNSGIGINTGYSSGTYGALSNTALSGNTIVSIGTLLNTTPPDPSTDGFYVDISGASAPAQNFFTSITINGFTFLTASATNFLQVGNESLWFWQSAFPISAGGIYAVTFI